VKLLALLAVAALLSACGAQTVQTSAGEMSAPTDATAAVIDQYQEEIPRLMKEQGVPGVSVAVVDDHGIVWSAGFGVTDTDDPEPVTADTIFSVQSTSKAFTATAVLLAVEDGLVDLDAPITTYLPDFTVHSIFEDHPESRITLRHLLSHTAGFTHEAPIGNNWDGDAGSFDAHIRSISDTWLRFPVGSGYAYSNLGIDLAGYILQVVSSRPFATICASGCSSG
jgi:CubicO group peptidase (beta-lactamase class C family)